MGWYEEYMSNTYITKLESVIKGIKEKDKLIDFLQEENKKLKNEHYEDNELKRLQDKIDQLQSNCSRGFPITENEQKVINKLREEHKKKCPCCSFKYVFEAFPVVEFGYLKCTVCGEELKFMER